jgi:glycine/D-amino acid oxidase-like deaminating enzyme
VKSTGAPWELDLPANGADTWVDRVDVAIVGGGLAALACAAFLAEGGAHVVLFEADARFGGLAGRGLGLARPGFVEHAHRIVAALGVDDARELIEFSLASLGQFDGLEGETLLAAIGPAEEEQVEAAVAAWQACGVPTRGMDASAVLARTGCARLGSGMILKRGGAVDPVATIASLHARALAAGAQLHGGCPVVAVTDGVEGLAVHSARGPVEAELVIVAADGGGGQLDGFLSKALHSVRTQFIAAPHQGASIHPCTAQQGYLAWASVRGHRVLEGCRWASPHLEVGETDKSVVNPKIDAKLREAWSGLLGQVDGPTHRWTALQTGSCDGLPLVGHLPGQPRLLTCAGFGGRPLGFAMEAARRLSDLALGRPGPTIPDRFLPQRMIP